MFNTKLKNKIKELEDLISKLTIENIALKNENTRLRETKPTQPTKTPYTTAITSTNKNPLEQFKYISTDSKINQSFDEVVAEIDNFSNRNYGNYNHSRYSHDSYSSGSSCDSGSSSSSSSCD